MHENRETSGAPRPEREGGRSAKAQSHKADAHALEESDRAIVSMNQPNKEEQSSAEDGDKRARAKENNVQPNTSPTQSGERVSQGLNGVREAAKKRRQERFTALLNHVSVDLLRDSYYALKRQAAPGVDGITWREYETGLEDRLVDLHSRVHRGAYRAQPSRRVYIPKADGRQRPLGIAALEDKIIQQAVVTILNQIYDLVVGFENRMEAERFLEAFRERLAKFGLELHPEKTRLIEFGRFAAPNREKRGEGKPETFTFLGFTRYCGKRRSNGSFIVWRKTAKKRMVAKLQAIKAELRLRMHEPVAAVGAWLRKVVNGYYRYHAVPGNIDRLSVFGQRVRRLWWLTLRRRSQRRAAWDRFLPIFTQWLPAPRVLHPHPLVRFLVTHPRWEPYA